MASFNLGDIRPLRRHSRGSLNSTVATLICQSTMAFMAVQHTTKFLLQGILTCPLGGLAGAHHPQECTLIENHNCSFRPMASGRIVHTAALMAQSWNHDGAFVGARHASTASILPRSHKLFLPIKGQGDLVAHTRINSEPHSHFNPASRDIFPHTCKGL